MSSKTDLFCIAIPAGWLAAPCCRHTVFYGPTELDAKHVITLLQYLNHTRKVKLVFRRDHHPISEEEGVNQFKPRNYRPPIFDASGRAPDVALTSAHGPGGVSVYDCGSSKVISRAVETALHKHF